MFSTTRRGFLLGVGAIAGAAGAGVGYQTVGGRLDRREHPPPGEMVDVGDHRLHLYSRGEASGGPTVVIDAASGGWSLDWHHVQTELSTTTRIVTYDRAGYGWSERGPTPRTSWQVADELRSALEVAGIDGPYVLVGHSFGGHTVRLLADELSEDVAGVVLVDARQEDVHRRLPPEATELPPLELFEATARLGIVRLMIAVQGADAPGLPPSLNEMEPDVRKTYLAIGFEPEYFRAVRGRPRPSRRATNRSATRVRWETSL
jgi:pimeloyl-ACP methyl ester carboxylesterase